MVKTLVFRKGNLGKLTSAITVENEPTSPPSQTPFLAFIRGKAEVGPVFQKLGFLKKKRRRGWTPGRLGTDASRTDSSIFTMKAHFLIFFFSFLFNFLSFPFSNLGFLILLSWLPQGAPPCPRAYGPRGWRGALGVLILHKKSL